MDSFWTAAKSQLEAKDDKTHSSLHFWDNYMALKMLQLFKQRFQFAADLSFHSAKLDITLKQRWKSSDLFRKAIKRHFLCHTACIQNKHTSRTSLNHRHHMQRQEFKGQSLSALVWVHVVISLCSYSSVRSVVTLCVAVLHHRAVRQRRSFDQKTLVWIADCALMWA